MDPLERRQCWTRENVSNKSGTSKILGLFDRKSLNVSPTPFQWRQGWAIRKNELYQHLCSRTQQICIKNPLGTHLDLEGPELVKVQFLTLFHVVSHSYIIWFESTMHLVNPGTACVNLVRQYIPQFQFSALFFFFPSTMIEGAMSLLINIAVSKFSFLFYWSFGCLYQLFSSILLADMRKYYLTENRRSSFRMSLELTSFFWVVT